MAVKRSTFLANIAQIKAENPRYQTGGTGEGGVCDCVGLLMGAMYAAGRKAYPMHCSNYFARYRVARGRGCWRVQFRWASWHQRMDVQRRRRRYKRNRGQPDDLRAVKGRGLSA